MKKIFGFLTNRWFLIIVGLIALGLLIWFVGPLISIGDATPLASGTGRLVTIVVFGSTFFLTRVVSYISTMRHNRQMLEDLVGKGGQAAGTAGPAEKPPEEKAREEADAASKEEVATLKKDLEQALTVLKKARLGERKSWLGRQYVYELPWYVFIGPPGSGKTTALINSGLRFPLAKEFGRSKFRGVGGTRNCDWWFTDEAVLLDTAGRYTTQDSRQEVDQAAWRSFLTLLKKHRRRRPLNGAMVAISVADLLQLSEEERAEQAQAIKDRIQELYEQLEIRFPVYVLFTKCDLIAGFMEFFSDLGQEERAQVWGMTFPLDDPSNPKGVVEHFAREFSLLERRLDERLVERLQEEKDPERRDLIYNLPKQFAALKHIADDFLAEIFHPTRFAIHPILRGVYFTSGTQEGAPIDRLMRSVASAFGLGRKVMSAFSGTGRSYFITRLFRDVIFKEAELAGSNLRWERWRAWAQRGAYAGALAITALIASAWALSYARNLVYVNEVESQRQSVQSKADRLDPKQRELLATLPLLDAARAIPGGYADRDAGVPWLMGFGLYQGDKLGFEAIATYRRLLERAFLPRLILLMEKRLREGAADPAYLFETLRVYLMLDESQHFDPTAIRAWAQRDWERNLPRNVTKEERQQLLDHLNALLEQGPLIAPINLDRDLIAKARQRLSNLPRDQWLNAQLKQMPAASEAPPFRLIDSIGNDALRVFERANGEALTINMGTPGLYTRRGYYQVFIPESRRLIDRWASESWVLGVREAQSLSADERRQLTSEMCRLYLKDFTQAWRDLLADIKIRDFSSPPETVEILKILSGEASPLKKLVTAVARETRLEPDATPAADGDASVKGRISSFFSAAGSNPEKPLSPCETSDFEKQFAGYARELEGSPSPLDATLATLGDLHGQMVAITRAGEGGEVPQDLKDKLETIAVQLESQADRKPAPLNGILTKLAKDVPNVPLGLRERLNSFWQAEKILDYYRERLGGHYPMTRCSISTPGQIARPAPLIGRTFGQTPGQSPNPCEALPDASLKDFGRFFGPNGFMETFFQKYLAPYVDTSQTPWRWRASGEESISSEALRAFQDADVIKRTLFGSTGSTPLVSFELEPIFVDPAAGSFVLDLQGQTVTHSYGQPARAMPLRWPGNDPAGGVRIAFGNVAGLSERGPWAWFKVLDRSQIRALSQTGPFIVTFQTGGYEAQFQMRTNGKPNPFRLSELENFQCPETL